jgi:hypothetical protein
VQWNFTSGGFAAMPRIYEVRVQDPATNVFLETLLSFSTGTQAENPIGDTGWQAHSADLSAYAGSTIRLLFHESIPQSFTGPGQIEFDGITLLGGRATNVDSLISNFVSGPGTYMARVTGRAGADYSLVVNRNGDFDVEENDDIEAAQPVSEMQVAGGHWVLGFITAGSLYGGSKNGDLFTIDTATGAGSLVGWLPGGGSTEIEHDNLTGRSFTQFPGGALAGQEFDIDTGAGIGDPIPDGAVFTGLEWVDTSLYGTTLDGPGSPSLLRTLDPLTGRSVPIGATGIGPISGLAYDVNAGVMYGIAGGPGPAALYTIDLGSGAAVLVGTTGFQAGSLEFGPDGGLYGGGTGPDGGLLFRIDPATAASTRIGSTGFSTVSGLALKHRPDRDFYAISVTRNKKIKVTTHTPAATSGEFVNRLDPILRLYDADGNLLATDDNSLADGRNARLEFKSRGAGLFYVEVAASRAGLSSGEYLLKLKYAE